MADGYSRDTGNQVKISVALVIVQVLVFSLNNKNWLFVEVEVNSGSHVLISLGLDLFI